MKLLLALLIIVLSCEYKTLGKRHRKFNQFDYLNDESTEITVERIPPSISECTCSCCNNRPIKPEPLIRRCPNDIVVAVDSSACFRDHHSRTTKFLKKLVRRIGRGDRTKYGSGGTRLALLQFSSDLRHNIDLSSFENYTNPASSRPLMSAIEERLRELEFLGEGAFLNKALNATADMIRDNPRGEVTVNTSSNHRKIVIVITNGNSHPSVTMDDIENSINALEEVGAIVLPVSVTRECPFLSNDGALCPNPVVMRKLAQVGNFGSEKRDFMEMTSQDTLPDILNVLQCDPPDLPQIDGCKNNCTCSCEFKSLPQGEKGEKGDTGDSVKGDRGDQGKDGNKGNAGEKGDEGDKGERGEDGNKGEVGEKGERGEEGPEGEKGDNGIQGDLGEKGEKGEPSEEGNKGDKGENGEKGEAGEKGSLSEKGDTGEKGESGIKGERGPEGIKGEKGFGEDGEPGAPGLKGSKGDSGERGLKGSQAEKGKRGRCGKPGLGGKQGELGLPGIAGRDGPPGPRGIQGPRGEPGFAGQKGQAGEIGMDGTKGEPGLPGARGPSGLQGTRGSKGTKGEPSNVSGPAGLQGVTGGKGEPGNRGNDGLDGRQGPRGSQGLKGQKGEQGPLGELNEENLRELVRELIRELLPGEDEDTVEPIPTKESTAAETTTVSSTTSTTEAPTTTTTTVSTTTTEPTPGSTTTAPTIRSTTILDEICSGDPPFGNCIEEDDVAVPLEKFYWNKTSQTCDAFTHKRCPGSNIFDTKEDCVARCQMSITTPPPEPTITPPRCQEARVGIALVLDNSASVGERKFNQLRDFLNSVANQFDEFGPNGLQMAAVTYNGEPTLEFGFNDTSTQQSLLTSLSDLNYKRFQRGNSFTGRAIEFTGTLFDNIGSTTDNPQPTRMVVVITDGRSADNVETPSNNLKRRDVVLFAIGADGAESEDLDRIASQTSLRQHVYTLPDYEALSDITDSLVENICLEARGIYRHRDTTKAPETTTEDIGSQINIEEAAF